MRLQTGRLGKSRILCLPRLSHIVVVISNFLPAPHRLFQL